MKLSSLLGVSLLGCAAFFSTHTQAQDAANAPGAAAILLESTGAADVIIYNARVLTVDSNFSVAQAVAIRDGRILAVGKDRQLETLRGPETRLIDAQGRTVMPGLYDASVHSYKAAVSELKAPVPVIDSIVAAQDYIRRQATNKPASGWITLDWTAPTRLKEGRLPTKADLDAATTNYAVYWNFGPVAIVNSKALALSKITKETQNPKDGEIEKDPKRLTPTGLLRNAASALKLPPAAKPPTKQQEREALKKLYQLYNSQGITSIGEAQTGPEEIDLFRDMSRSNELTVRINCARLFDPGQDLDAAIDRLNALTNVAAGKQPYGPTGVGDDWVRIGALKTVVDGDASIGTAYLRTPYGIGPTYKITELAYRGEAQQDSYLLPQFYAEATQRGWQLAGHASGDAALEFLLNAYEKVQFQTNIQDRRFLVTHSDFQSAQDLARCAKLGLGVVLEPGSLYQDGSSLLKTLGTNRLDYFVQLKGWFDHGITAGGASDHLAGLDSRGSVNPWNPWLGIWTTVTRETSQGTVIKPAEQLTREQAIRFYTINNAWLNFEDTKKGSIEAGKLADLIVVDTDITKCQVSEIRDTKVLLTMVNGRVVYEARLPVFPGPELLNPAITGNLTNQSPATAGAQPVYPITDDSQSAIDLAKAALGATNTATAVLTNAATAVASTNEVPSVVTTNETASVIAKPDAAVQAAGFAADAAEAELEPAVAVASPATVSVTNQATVITVSNQTASVTVTIQPTAVVTSPEPSVAVTNFLAPAVPAVESAPSAVSTNAANAAPAPLPGIPAAMNEPPAVPPVAAVPTASSEPTAAPVPLPTPETPAAPPVAVVPPVPAAVPPVVSATQTNSVAAPADWSHLPGEEAKK